SIVLFERTVLKKDFSAILAELEPGIRTAAPGRLASIRFPFLRRLVALGPAPGVPTETGGAIESWSEFLAHGEATARSLVDAAVGTALPGHGGAIFFSSGSRSLPKGVIGSHRSVAIQCWRWPRMFALEGDVRCWAANGFFWSGNFTMAMGCTLAAGGTIVLQP